VATCDSGDVHVVEDPTDCPDDERCEPPAPALRYALDDPADPATVTVYPGEADEADLVTTWVSVDVDSAVPLAEMR
jgi:hypothetical protein